MHLKAYNQTNCNFNRLIGFTIQTCMCVHVCFVCACMLYAMCSIFVSGCSTCVYVYTHVYVRTQHVYTHIMYIHTHMYLCMFMCVRTYVCTHTCTACVCVYVCTHTCVYMMYMYMYIHMYVCIHTHACTYIRIYVYVTCYTRMQHNMLCVRVCMCDDVIRLHVCTCN